jgi:hypothetical protein
MQTFTINKHLEIVCQAEKTRYGFRHLATLLEDGREADKAKCCYYNRTWEKYEFGSVIGNLLGKTTLLTQKEKDNFLERWDKNCGRELNEQFGTIAKVAKLGEIFCAGDKKATNDWKARMIKAGLGDKGLIMPEDWDQLSEEDKEARLDGVIKQLTK